MRKLKLITFLLFIGITFNSCKKVKRTYLLKGKWELTSFKINGGENNVLDDFFLNYKEGNGRVEVLFSDNGVVKYEYWTFNKKEEESFGYWKMHEHNIVEFRVSPYLDGIFEVSIVNPKNAILFTEENDIQFYNVGKVKAVIETTLIEE